MFTSFQVLGLLAFRATELLGCHACDVHLLPSLGVVSLPRGINRLTELVKLEVAGSQLGVVGDGRVQELSGFEGALLVEPIAYGLDVGGVRATDELLHLSQ